MNGDCNICINGKLPSYSASCVECGLLRKNYKPMTNADRLRAMTDEELAKWLVWHANPEITCEYDDFEIGNYSVEYRGALNWLKSPVEAAERGRD